MPSLGVSVDSGRLQHVDTDPDNELIEPVSDPCAMRWFRATRMMMSSLSTCCAFRTPPMLFRTPITVMLRMLQNVSIIAFPTKPLQDYAWKTLIQEDLGVLAQRATPLQQATYVPIGLPLFFTFRPLGVAPVATYHLVVSTHRARPLSPASATRAISGVDTRADDAKQCLPPQSLKRRVRHHVKLDNSPTLPCMWTKTTPTPKPKGYCTTFVCVRCNVHLQGERDTCTSVVTCRPPTVGHEDKEHLMSLAMTTALACAQSSIVQGAVGLGALWINTARHFTESSRVVWMKEVGSATAPMPFDEVTVRTKHALLDRPGATSWGSKPFRCVRGCLQGCPLSVTLANMILSLVTGGPTQNAQLAKLPCTSNRSSMIRQCLLLSGPLSFVCQAAPSSALSNIRTLGVLGLGYSPPKKCCEMISNPSLLSLVGLQRD
eukprot:4165767-Amphidinium_carterae.1